MPNRASSSISYGSSGTGKTTEIGRLARYVHRTTGKKTRLISADGGGWDTIQDVIDEGLIEAYQVGSLTSPVETMRKFSRGDWPTASGSGTAVMKPTDWSKENIGAYAIEGLTSVGDAVMKALRLKGAKIGESPNYAFTEGSETFYGSNMSYYGFIQDVLYEFVNNFGQLPVQYVMWTALESKGEDDQRVATYGPSIAGKKAIAKCIAWFGDCLHHDSVTVEKKDAKGNVEKDSETGAKILVDKIRVYFTRHPDPQTGIVYPAKVRVPAAKLPELLKDPRFARGFYEPSLTGGLDWLLEVEERLRKGKTEGTAK
jgi:hypothetical protein